MLMNSSGIMSLDEKVERHDCKLSPDDGCDICEQSFSYSQANTRQQQRLNNIMALSDVMAAYTDGKDDPQVIFEKYPHEAMSYLRLRGFRCIECRENNITFPVLKFHDFRPETKCYDCQYSNKLN